MLFFGVLLNTLQQGLCYSLVALGVYISYKILNFPDLTVDSSFPLGAIVGLLLIKIGCPFVIAVLLAFLSGCLAGLITGFLHVKFKINPLLSGIITMTALLSINFLLASGKPIISYDKKETLFNNGFTSLFGEKPIYVSIGNIIILVVVVIIGKVLLDLFFKTKCGYMLRAVGDNEQMSTALGSNIGLYKIMGLCLANGLVAMAGSMYSQYMGHYDSASGTGMVVIALASVIIGVTIFKKASIIKGTTMAIIGALIYTSALNFILALGVNASLLKLAMAITFAVVLIINQFSFSSKKKVKKGEINHV